MKKILIVNDLIEGGGVENLLKNLVSYLSKQGNEVSLMIPNCSKTDISNYFDRNIKFQSGMRNLREIKKYTPIWFWDRGFYVLKKQIYKFQIYMRRYDVVIALKEGFIMKEVAHLYAKQKFAWVHTDYSLMHWTENCFKSSEQEKKCMMRFNKVICVSKAAEQGVIRTIGNPGNLCVKYNPIDYIDIRKKSMQFCTQSRKKNGILFVSIGRLAYPKNYSMLIDVCSKLIKKYSFELWIIGDGPDRKQLEKKISQNKLTSVKLLGSNTNPFPYLMQADVFISSSLAESYGIAIQEALIVGKPVIAVKCPAIEENFDNRFGILTEGNCQSLEQAIEEILSKPEQIKNFRKNIEEKYDVKELYEKRLKEIEKLWEDK